MNKVELEDRRLKLDKIVDQGIRKWEVRELLFREKVRLTNNQ